HCPGLAAPIGNRDYVRRVVDNDFVVNVDEDYVVRRRRRYVSRRANPNRNRRVDRNRQHEYGHGRGGRREHHEHGWRRRKEDDRRGWRWHEREHRIIEDENRPLDIDDLVGWWRRQVVFDHGELRRRLERRRQKSKTTVRVGRVRAIRISPQIGPIGSWRIDHAGTSPSDCLAPSGNDGARPSG